MGQPTSGGKALKPLQSSGQAPQQAPIQQAPQPQPQFDPSNPAHLGQLPGGGNQAVLDLMRQAGGARRPLVPGNVASASIESDKVYAAVAALWDEVACWGDQADEDPQGFLQEWSSWAFDLYGPVADASEAAGTDGLLTPTKKKDIGNAWNDGNPTLSDCPISGAVLAALSGTHWQSRNAWDSGQFDVCMGTTGHIKMSAYVENEEARDIGTVAIGASSTSTSGAAASHKSTETVGAEGATDATERASESSQSDTGGITTAMSTAGIVTAGDLILKIECSFFRVGEGKFGPKSIEINAGRVIMMGVPL